MVSKMKYEILQLLRQANYRIVTCAKCSFSKFITVYKIAPRRETVDDRIDSVVKYLYISFRIQIILLQKILQFFF